MVRARVTGEHARRDKPWKSFQPGRWYPAVETAEGTVMLTTGGVSAEWRREEVEIRGAGDSEWDIRATGRATTDMEGQRLEYPMRIAECPEGHVRQIPTRFTVRTVTLTCRDCGRSYRLPS
jgi:hypothetical protein